MHPRLWNMMRGERDGVTVSLLNNTASGADGSDSLTSVENIQGSNSGDTLQLAAMRGVDLRELPGVAHVAPEESPDRLGALVAELLTR